MLDSVQAPSSEAEAAFKCSLVCTGLERIQRPGFSIAVRCNKAGKPEGASL